MVKSVAVETYLVTRPHSSVDRALASGAKDGGSSLPGGTCVPAEKCHRLDCFY